MTGVFFPFIDVFEDMTLGDALAEIGELAGLTVVAWVAAGVVGVVLAVGVATLLPGSSAALLGVVFLAGLLSVWLLFGRWEWGPGGETRQHVVFLGCQLVLWLLVAALGSLVPTGNRPLPGAQLVYVLALLFTTPVAGWLAYYGGLARVRRSVGHATRS